MGETSAKKLINNTWSLLIGNGLFQVLNILFLLILVRVFKEVDYACYRQGNLIIMTFSPLFVLGLPMTLSYFLPRTADLAVKKTYVYQTLGILLVLGLLAGALMMAFGGWIAEIYNNELLKPYMWAFAVNFFVAVVYSYYPFYMVSMNKSRRMAVVTVLFAVMKLATVILSLVISRDFLFFITIFSATEVVKLLVVLVQPLFDFRNVKLSFSRPQVTGQVKFALPICLTNIVTAFNRNLDKNLTSAFYTTGQFAVYANGAFDVPMINVLRTSIMGAMFPMFSERYSENDQKEKNSIISMFRKSIVVVAMALIPLTGALMLYSGGAVLLLFSETYADSATIFFIYMLLIPAQIADFGSMLIVANRQKATAVYTVLATLVLAGLFILFKQTLGFHYVALAAVISQYLLILLILLKTKSVYGQRSLAGVFPVKEVLVLIGITAAFYALFSAVNGVLRIGEPQKSLILGMAYFASCTAAGVAVLKDYRKLFLKSLFRKAAK